jgi:WD40 repeat protein
VARRKQLVAIALGFAALLGAIGWFVWSQRGVDVFEPERRLVQGHGPFPTVDLTGDLLAFDGEEGKVVLWDLPGAETPRLVLEPPLRETRAIAISPAGDLVAAGGKGAPDRVGSRLVRIWSTKDGAVVRDLDEPVGCDSLAFSPDGARLLIYQRWSQEDTARIWDVATGKLVRTVTFPQGKPVYAAAWSSSGDLFAVAGYAPSVWIFSAATGEVVRTLETDGEWVTRIAFSPDDAQVAVAGDSHVTIFDRDGRRVRKLDAPGDTNTDVCFLPDGRLAASSNAGEIWVYASHWPWLVERRIHAGTPGVYKMAAAPRLGWIATASNDGPVRLFRAW